MGQGDGLDPASGQQDRGESLTVEGPSSLSLSDCSQSPAPCHSLDAGPLLLKSSARPRVDRWPPGPVLVVSLSLDLDSDLWTSGGSVLWDPASCSVMGLATPPGPCEGWKQLAAALAWSGRGPGSPISSRARTRVWQGQHALRHVSGGGHFPAQQSSPGLVAEAQGPAHLGTLAPRHTGTSDAATQPRRGLRWSRSQCAKAVSCA